ncbi:MAG: DUF6968 family protein [Gemmatimonadota bacterium]
MRTPSDVIATRELAAHAADGTRHVVRLRLFASQAWERDWRCRYEIDGGGMSSSAAGHGVDSLQALMNAQIMMSAFVISEARAHRLRLTWLGSNALGLPNPE